MRIEILGMGCPKCQATEGNVRKAVAELGMEAEIVHVRDPKEFAKYGVAITPAVAVDGKVMVSGQVPTVAELKKMLKA